MRTPAALLNCIAKVLVIYASEIPFAGFAVDVAVALARDVWKRWGKHRRQRD